MFGTGPRARSFLVFPDVAWYPPMNWENITREVEKQGQFPPAVDAREIHMIPSGVRTTLPRRTLCAIED
ncbi:MAG: hypothetical protein CMJ81_07505 [Planctomycetaceae bacterium]|nr:hypothetical protein [Planctomycetaceae bacterium]MBP63055.1 hypothetical protein [Planctomycetaceae bacterium]